MDTNAPATSSKGTPEKFVRTFAGDMETFQKGGTPDLVPLSASSETSQGTAAPHEPPVVPAPPAPIPVPAEKQPLPPPAPVPPAPTNAPIKTYSSDFIERMKGLHATTATVLAAEQDSAPVLVDSSAETPPARHATLYIIAGALLLVAGIAGATVAYLRYQTSIEPVISASPTRSPIFVDDREQITGSGAALLLSIEKSVARPLASGSVRLLSMDDTTESVFAALPLSAPGALLRNTIADGSMAGVIRASSVQTPFFILSVSSYSNTFGSMLSWEKSMPRDLSQLFPSYAAVASVATPAPVATTTATSSSQVMVPVTVAGFVDTVVANHDVRVYRDSAGRDVLLYGYWNQTTLVIARNSAAFAEILGRLASSRAQK
ncbi:MAG: hypothetical protein PHD04_02345 [Candidatus Pacebacteria bacterium]|nr:hypothetical protein [Candidatus Paceibacterota bacterium]